MIARLKQNYIAYLFFLFSSFLFFWVAFRAVSLDITHDEAFTFQMIFTRNFNMMCGTANNHWLNSIFVFFETYFLSNNVWAIRVHSVISFIFFTYYLFNIFKHFIQKEILIFTPFVIILLNVYLLDFFSLSRGYAASMMFEIIAIYIIVKPNSNNHDRLLIYLILSLATFSNYTAIFILVAYFLHDIFLQIRQKNIAFLFSYNNLITCLPFIILMIFAIPNILFIKYTGDLEEGLSNGFVRDTLSVFIERSYKPLLNSKSSIIISWLLLLWISLFYFFTQNKLHHQIKKLFEITFISILISECMFFFFKIPYVFGRTSLGFNVLFLILISYSIIYLLNSLKQGLITSIIIVLLLLSSLHFIVYKNHQTTIEWWAQQGLQECLIDFKNETINKKNINLGLFEYHYGSTINYYFYIDNDIKKYNINRFYPIQLENFNATVKQELLSQDYLLMMHPYESFLNKNEYNFIKHYKSMNSDLLKINKQP